MTWAFSNNNEKKLIMDKRNGKGESEREKTSRIVGVFVFRLICRWYRLPWTILKIITVSSLQYNFIEPCYETGQPSIFWYDFDE